MRDAADLYGIKSKYFDVVIANMSLMDIADAVGAIQEASRVLRGNGHFIFSITHPAFCDFRQQWVIIKENAKKYFARAVSKYLSSAVGRYTLWASGIKTTQYHRSIETYFEYLRNANFLVSEFREIATKKPVRKAEKEDGDVKLHRSRYTTFAEKRMKEFAGKEIPFFLVIGALKIK